MGLNVWPTDVDWYPLAEAGEIFVCVEAINAPRNWLIGHLIDWLAGWLGGGVVEHPHCQTKRPTNERLSNVQGIPYLRIQVTGTPLFPQPLFHYSALPSAPLPLLRSSVIPPSVPPPSLSFPREQENSPDKWVSDWAFARNPCPDDDCWRTRNWLARVDCRADWLAGSSAGWLASDVILLKRQLVRAVAVEANWSPVAV